VIGGAGFRRHWKLEGESLARVPRGFDPAHPLADELRRKDHTAMCSVAAEDFSGPMKPLVDRFAAAVGYLGFLCEALDLAL
jgi:uncharacterized protein (DUF2461 family)